MVLDSKDASRIRIFFIWLVQTSQFDLFILVCIIVNTLFLAVDWYSCPADVRDILDQLNYVFALIFLLEAVFKLIAFQSRVYFSDQGNRFDFAIVIATLISSITSLMLKVNFGASTTFIKALRISRIFKFIRLARQIKILFETMVVTIPTLTSMGGLLLLFLYIYSVLGVFLFAEVQLQTFLAGYA